MRPANAVATRETGSWGHRAPRFSLAVLQHPLRQSASQPAITLGPMSGYDDDRPTPSELEQLARSLSLDGSVGRRDALVIAEQLRRLARIDSTFARQGPTR